MFDSASPLLQPRRRGLLWFLFLLPGTVIAWWQYHFPKPGQEGASARRKDEPAVRLLYSLAFWPVVVVLLVYALVIAFPRLRRPAFRRREPRSGDR